MLYEKILRESGVQTRLHTYVLLLVPALTATRADWCFADDSYSGMPHAFHHGTRFPSFLSLELLLIGAHSL